MKTSVETVSGVEKRVRVVIPADEVGRKMEEGYAEVRKAVPVRGFRKGKAPMSMVKRLFKEHVEGEVAERLIKDSIHEAVKENDLRVLSTPDFDGGKLKEGEEFAFTVTFEVMPEVAAADYKGLPVTKEKVEITDAKVDAALSGLRESFASYHTVEERGAAEGDLLEVNISSSAGGDAIDSGESSSLILGGGMPFGKNFEDALAGAKAGDRKTIEVEYPEEAPNKKYAGKKVTFDVTVNAIREKKLPEFDEEFAKNFTDVKDLNDLRSRMAERLRAEGDERSRRNAEEHIRNGLLEKNTFDVPHSLVDRQIVLMIEDTAKRMASQGIDLKKVNMDFDKMRERFAPGAERIVRVSLLLEAVARQESIDVPYSDIEAEMKAMAEAAQMSFEKVREIYGDEERLDALRTQLLERKTMAFLLENATVKEEVASE
ncbi:MAG: trigger factor [Deltaproteobacteria bacterium]|nr:trigger factor [Deltaproteobacteria bacterium]